MTAFKTDWTRKEFKAYLLLYASETDQVITEEEKELILENISKGDFEKIREELAHDNDYQSIQKILYNIEKYNYSKEDISGLLRDIKNLFLSDGHFDTVEKNMLLALKRLLQQ